MSCSRSLFFVLASACLAFAHSAAAAQEHRRLLDTTARELNAVTTEVAEASSRELYIDPNAKPTSTQGWNCIISIISSGKFTTVNNIKLRTAIATLGFPTNSANFQFGGNAATTNWRSITAFVVNIPSAASADAAVKAVKGKITVKHLNAIAGLPKANPVLQVILTAFKA